MTKTRAFSLVHFAFATAAAFGGAAASAGPVHPCDDGIAFVRTSPVALRPVFVQPAFVQSAFVQPVVVQPGVPSTSTVVTVPPGSDVAIRQSWAGDSTVRISTPAIAPVVVDSGYRAAWADAHSGVVSSTPVAGVVTSPSILVIPGNAVAGRGVAVEPFDAHDRLVVLNEFSRPGYDGGTLLYRDATGLLHERTVYSNSGIFYDHLGRRCRYDHGASMIIVLDDRVVRDYNRNGVCDDDRYVDLHRRAALNFHRSTLHHPIGTRRITGGDWRDNHRTTGLRPSFDTARSPAPRDRAGDAGRSTTDRPTTRAVNGRLRDDSRLTGNDRKSTRSTTRPKR